MPTVPRRRSVAAAALITSLVVGLGSSAYADAPQAPLVTDGAVQQVTAAPARIPELPRGVRIANRYLRTYGAERVGWDKLIDRGKRLPKVSAACARSWRSSGKDRRLDWSSASYLCMDTLLGGSFKPQGLGGSATTENYLIDDRPATERNLLVTSWYSRAAEPGLFAPNESGESVTQLVVIDLDRRRYNTVELVKPVGSTRLGNLNSHGSGVVWAGQYLYSSSKSQLWMYNADDLLEVDGHYVLPAVSRWSVKGVGGLSSISLDQTTVPTRLVGIDYTKASRATLQSFDLAPDGQLADHTLRTSRQLTLTNTLGAKGRVVRSGGSQTVPGTSFQGVARYGPYTLANSSALRLGGRAVDAAVVLRDGLVLDRLRMPHGNGQSIYLDYLRGRFSSTTEAGSQFLYSLPLEQLIGPDGG